MRIITEDNVDQLMTLVEDENIRTQATVMINKVGQLEVLLEALNFTSSTHRANLEALLKDCPESLVESKEEEVVEDIVETPTEDLSLIHI